MEGHSERGGDRAWEGSDREETLDRHGGGSRKGLSHGSTGNSRCRAQAMQSPQHCPVPGAELSGIRPLPGQLPAGWGVGTDTKRAVGAQGLGRLVPHRVVGMGSQVGGSGTPLESDETVWGRVWGSLEDGQGTD